MNFLDFNGIVGSGETNVAFGETSFEVPRMIDGANGNLTFGVRPEHIILDDSANYRGEVSAVEYLGTTQIITLKTSNGTIKSRIASSDAVQVGHKTGLRFDPRTVSIFDADSGHVLKSEANIEGLNHG